MSSAGKGALLSVLRQLARLKTGNQAGISVGFVGYPNVGKSSVINTLRSKKVRTRRRDALLSLQEGQHP